MSADKETLPAATKQKKAATLARKVRNLGRRIRQCPLPLVHRQHGAAEQAVAMLRDVERMRYVVELRRQRYTRAVEQVEIFRKAVETWESDEAKRVGASVELVEGHPEIGTTGSVLDFARALSASIRKGTEW